MVLLHICGDLAISPLFCDDQYTEYESCEMKIGIAGPILTKKTPNTLWDMDFSTLQNR